MDWEPSLIFASNLPDYLLVADGQEVFRGQRLTKGFLWEAKSPNSFILNHAGSAAANETKLRLFTNSTINGEIVPLENVDSGYDYNKVTRQLSLKEDPNDGTRAHRIHALAIYQNTCTTLTLDKHDMNNKGTIVMGRMHWKRPLTCSFTGRWKTSYNASVSLEIEDSGESITGFIIRGEEKFPITTEEYGVGGWNVWYSYVNEYGIRVKHSLGLHPQNCDNLIYSQAYPDFLYSGTYVRELN